uniref:G_PROTEIN_RECEP_F1_2 domain-containing protein n=1 Tax=Steinernema glaseri TaxID=37863 RepID=A0A1I8AED0_9BILA
MQLINHGAALMDLLLEPYLIYLILRYSPPAMSIYRWFLLAISFTNLAMTLNFAVIWSPIIEVRGFDFCLPSSYLSGSFVPFLHALFCVTLYAQWQLLLASLAYAVIVVFLFFFACFPGAVHFPLQRALFINDVCLTLPVQFSSFMLLVWFAIHLTSYVAASIYLLRKLGQAINDPTSATSVQTVKLVKTARRNFIILVAVIIFMGVTPAFLVVGALAFMRNDQMQTVMTVVARYT